MMDKSRISLQCSFWVSVFSEVDMLVDIITSLSLVVVVLLLLVGEAILVLFLKRRHFFSVLSISFSTMLLLLSVLLLGIEVVDLVFNGSFLLFSSLPGRRFSLFMLFLQFSILAQ